MRGNVMNLIQLAEQLKDQPMSVLDSEDIREIMQAVNPILPDDMKVKVDSTGTSISKNFYLLDADKQEKLMQPILSAKRYAAILRLLQQVNDTEALKDKRTADKWNWISMSVTVPAMVVSAIVVIIYLATSATRAPLPEAVISNVLTHLLEMLAIYINKTA